MKLRCLNGKKDALNDWAEHWINTATLSTMRPMSIRDDGPAQVVVLDRDGQFQAELCIFRGGVVIPPHTHPSMDSIETGIAGGVRFTIDGREMFRHLSDERLIGLGIGRGLRFNSYNVHSGTVLPCGAVFMSLQHWRGEPTSVGLDYVGHPISEQQATWLRALKS